MAPSPLGCGPGLRRGKASTSPGVSAYILSKALTRSHQTNLQRAYGVCPAWGHGPHLLQKPHLRQEAFLAPGQHADQVLPCRRHLRCCFRYAPCWNSRRSIGSDVPLGWECAGSTPPGSPAAQKPESSAPLRQIGPGPQAADTAGSAPCGPGKRRGGPQSARATAGEGRFPAVAADDRPWRVGYGLQEGVGAGGGGAWQASDSGPGHLRAESFLHARSQYVRFIVTTP